MCRLQIHSYETREASSSERRTIVMAKAAAFQVGEQAYFYTDIVSSVMEKAR